MFHFQVFQIIQNKVYTINSRCMKSSFSDLKEALARVHPFGFNETGNGASSCSSPDICMQDRMIPKPMAVTSLHSCLLSQPGMLVKEKYDKTVTYPIIQSSSFFKKVCMRTLNIWLQACLWGGVRRNSWETCYKLITATHAVDSVSVYSMSFAGGKQGRPLNYYF